MKKPLTFIILILTLLSCQQELKDDVFETSAHGLARRAYLIEETMPGGTYLHPEESTETLFAQPAYDMEGRVAVVYNNFAGYEANTIYTYKDNEIIVTMNCRDGRVIRRRYALVDGLIVSCTETRDSEETSSEFSYTYDANKSLRTINSYIGKYDSHSTATITRTNGNITAVECSRGGTTYGYTFKYIKPKSYAPVFPMFHNSCYEIGNAYGVDEILLAENYFGNSVDRDLLTEIYFENVFSRRFEYDLDSKGYITAIRQLDTDSDKIIRLYNITW